MSKGPGDTHLARALYSWREDMGLNQYDAAREIGIPHRSYQDYERGKTERPSAKNMKRISQKLDKSREELLAGPAHTTDAIERQLDLMRRSLDRLSRKLEAQEQDQKPRKKPARTPAAGSRTKRQPRRSKS